MMCFELMKRRRMAKLTQAALAQRAGLSMVTIGRIERGVAVPDAGTMRKLAWALNLTTAELFPEILATQERVS